MNNKTIRELLKPVVSTLSLKGDVWTARKEFFYTQKRTSQDFVNAIKEKLQCEIEVIEHQECWKPFRGGASTANSSHWLVKFKVI